MSATEWHEATFELQPRPPFRLDLTAWAIRRRARNRMDTWDGTYRRALIIEGEAVVVEVRQAGSAVAPVLVVNLSSATELTPARLRAVQSVLERLLGLGIDLDPFYEMAAADPHLRVLKDRFVGVKPPRFPTMFEAFANAVANQQLSLEVGIELLNRLTDTYGAQARSANGEMNAFPEAEVIADAPMAALRSLGFSMSKAGYLVGLADAVSSGSVALEGFDLLSRQDATQHLQRLRGIGRWSAEYVMLRGFGRLDVFPGDDVGARNKLQRFLDLTSPPSYTEIAEIVAPWHPYGGLVYFHLLLDGLVERGALVL